MADVQELQKLIINIEAQVSNTEEALKRIGRLSEEQAKNVEKNFAKARINIETYLATKKLSEVQAIYEKLKNKLEEKITMNADLGSINKIQNAIKAVEGIFGGIDAKYSGKSLQDLLKIAKDLQTELAKKTALNVDVRGINNLRNELNSVNKAIKDVAGAQRGELNPAMGNANYTAMSAIGIVSDLQYGYRGVMNNIQQTATQLSWMAGMTDANTGKTLGYSGALKMLGSSLVGANGALLGIMAVTTGLGFLLDNTGKAANKTEKFSLDVITTKTILDEYRDSIRGVRKELEGLSNEELNDKIQQLENSLRHFNEPNIWRTTKEYLAMAFSTTPLTSGIAKYLGLDIKSFVKNEFTKVSSITETLKEAKDIQGSTIAQLKREIADYEKMKFTPNLKANSYLEINNEINKRQQELNKLQKNSEDLAKDKEKAAKRANTIANDAIELEGLKYKAGKKTLEEYINYLIIQRDMNRGNSKEEVERFVKLNELIDELKKKFNLENTEIMGIAFEVKDQEKIFKELEKEAERKGIKFDPASKEYQLAIALTMTANKTGGGGRLFEMSEVKMPDKPKLNGIDNKNDKEIREQGITDWEKENKQWAGTAKETINGITNAWQNGFNDWLTKGKTFGAAMGQVWQNMGALIISTLSRIAIQFGMLQAAKAIFSNATGGFGGFLIKALGGHNGGTFYNDGSGVKRMARGGVWQVPSGYPNDTYPLLVESKELVEVTPAKDAERRKELLRRGSEFINRGSYVINNSTSNVNSMAATETLLRQLGTKIDAMNINNVSLGMRANKMQNYKPEVKLRGNDLVMAENKTTRMNRSLRG